MKKQLTLIPLMALVFVLSSCDTDLGTPPALVLSFSLDYWEDTVSGLTVDYTLTNDGEEDLRNCKIQLGIDTTDDGDYEDPGDYTYWTDGVDLGVDETYSVDNVEISIIGDAYNVIVLAAGFDNPPDSKGAGERTIIYYED